MITRRLAAYGQLRRLWTSYLALGATALVLLAGAAAMVEMVYHLQLGAAMGPELRFLGATLNVQSVDSWFGCIFVLVTGIALFELARRVFMADWGAAQVEIEKEIKGREAQ